MSRRVLVTGSSRGIGREVALFLARDGFDVVVHCMTGVEAAQAVIEEIRTNGGNANLMQFDVGDRVACAALLTADIAAKGAYYGVVCNAGITRDHAFPAMNGDDWDEVINTNLNGFYNVTHPLLLPMIQARQGGRVVVMSSVSGLMGNRGQVNYSAAKAGLIGAAKALAVEVAKRGITVNCIAPGLIDTEMVEPEILQQALHLIPAQRVGLASEVASLASYLFSDNAAYITRQVISVNGGMV